jgi:hypothetical protein
MISQEDRVLNRDPGEIGHNRCKTSAVSDKRAVSELALNIEERSNRPGEAGLVIRECGVLYLESGVVSLQRSPDQRSVVGKR